MGLNFKWEPGTCITTHDIVIKMGELSKAVRVLAARVGPDDLVRVRDAGRHLLAMCFKHGLGPSVIRPTADDGIVFYFYPIPSLFSVYVCLEIYEDGDVVAASCNGEEEIAWDLGSKPSAEDVAEALRNFDALFPWNSPSTLGCLLSQVRKSWADPTISTIKVGEFWHVIRVFKGNLQYYWLMGKWTSSPNVSYCTEAEGLRILLDESPCWGE